MKIFLGWSGDASRQLADTFHDWIKNVVQTVEPFISTRDINKGSDWHSFLTGTLNECKFGIFFLTKENKSNPWMHFEAGALSKEIGELHVCPIIFRINESELDGPFAYFQATHYDKDDMYRLVKEINANMSKPISDEVLKESFNTFWPRLDKKINELETVLETEKNGSIAYVKEHNFDQYKKILYDIIKRENIKKYGLEDIYNNRLRALESIRDEIESEGKELIIIGSSLKGLIGIGGDSAGRQNLVRISIIDALKRNVKVRILITNPEIAHHRSKQEGRAKGEIEGEIFENLIYFIKEKRHNKEVSKNLEIKLYAGAPTIFLLSTSHKMFFNPYTFYSKAFESFCFKVNKDSSLSESYYNDHYLAAWNDNNLSIQLKRDLSAAIQQVQKLIEGKNQHNELLIPEEGMKIDLLNKLKEISNTLPLTSSSSRPL